jgi:hypothetical protein
MHKVFGLMLVILLETFWEDLDIISIGWGHGRVLLRENNALFK